MKHLVSVMMMLMAILLTQVALAQNLCFTPDRQTRIDLDLDASGQPERLRLNAFANQSNPFGVDVPQTMATFARERGSLSVAGNVVQADLSHPQATFHRRGLIAGQAFFEIQSLSLMIDFSQAVASPGGEQAAGELVIHRKDGRTLKIQALCFRPLED